MTNSNAPWVERLQVVGKAQARYLWILLVTMIFYAALEARVGSSVGDTSLKVPFVDLELSGAVLLGSGPVVISFLVLAILGTMRAYSSARQKLGLGRADWSGEELDTSPNAIDLAFYTTPRSPKIVATVTHFVYAVFLLAGLVEAAWLERRLVGAQAAGWCVFAAMGALLWLPAAWLLCSVFYRRVREVPTLWRTK